MALTATQLRTLLKRHLRNDTSFSDPTDFDTFLTLAQQMMVREAPGALGIKEGTLSLTIVGGRTYSLASDFFQMKNIWEGSVGRELYAYSPTRFIDEVERQVVIPSRVPEGYLVTGYSESDGFWKIKFDATPDASYTVTYWYYWMPSDVSGSTVPAISAIGFGETLLWGATMLARETNDPDGYLTAQQNYERGMMKYRTHDPMKPARSGIVDNDQTGLFSRLGPHFPADTGM